MSAKDFQNKFWKNLKKPFCILAPMEDVTDIAFRHLVEKLSPPDIFFTEFTNVEGMQSAGRSMVVGRLRINPLSKVPLVAQLWGKKPENFFKSAKELANSGFAGIDLNMGCPVKKITESGTCSALIDNPTLASEIIKATQEGVNGKVSISVKTRLGTKKDVSESWSAFLLEHNLDMLTIHGRLAKDLSKFPANWEAIGKVVEIRNVLKKDTLIVGNGDAISRKHAIELHEKYKVDGVMIGRGIFQNPFAFSENLHIDLLSPREKIEILKEHIRLFQAYWPNGKSYLVLRRFFKIYINNFENATKLKEKVIQTNSLEECLQILENF